MKYIIAAVLIIPSYIIGLFTKRDPCISHYYNIFPDGNPCTTCRHSVFGL